FSRDWSSDVCSSDLGIFGGHNLQNLQGAMEICRALGVSREQFYRSIPTFKGAAKRQEILAKNNSGILFRDFAHAPSKLKATVNRSEERRVGKECRSR